MYFKKLELVGFKSFSEKTTLHFEPGITAVVGPNGCGKSNIFDSIRWVLGEQSAKSLRGSDMQDVIFNGTDTKEPLGMAEVSLVFDNENRFFNFDHPEVMITRRIFRSGESEYLLNKTPVRLKDILDLLLGTGIGAESYSIVAQGKIDLVLSSRPEDRRLVFDEASGITKYKSQKRETQRKLEETDQNLLRINDIIAEVKRQIGSLERQANKARRYKEVFAELRQKEINLAIQQKRGLIKQKDEIIVQLKELEGREAELLIIVKEQEAKISNRQTELKILEDQMMSLKNQIMGLENTGVRSKEHIKFNSERLVELEESKKYLESQIEQARVRLIQDEEKLNKEKEEYGGLKKNIDEKTLILQENEAQISELASSIKNSLDNISKAKKDILDLLVRIANAKNEISDFNSRQQIYLARKKRLEIEKAKVFQERAITGENLNNITQETENLKKIVDELNAKISSVRAELENENLTLNNINQNMSELERQKASLESHKEFLEKLKSQYDDIGESMNAVIYLDKLPSETLSGLVVKIKNQISLSDEDKAYLEPANFKISGEAKPIELDTRKIEEKINRVTEDLESLKNNKVANEARIEELNKSVLSLQQEFRSQEIALANKETQRQSIQEQFNKIKEEEDIIVLELSDIQREIAVLEDNLTVARNNLAELNKQQVLTEDLIVQEEDNISLKSKAREEVLVIITQTKTELDALNKRFVSDEATLRLLEDNYSQDQDSLANIERQISDAQNRKKLLEAEIRDCENKIAESSRDTESQNILLNDIQAKYQGVSDGASDFINKIESDRKDLEEIKSRLYDLQMQNKDIDYKFASIKERMLQAYKIELESMEDLVEVMDISAISGEIDSLKQKLDSYGTVNLVAIEEYDELKKRYDFLVQQQTDLVTAKESLHQAILKINRTTKQMFLETFEKVRVEFRNYFRMLFNGGDAQVYLIDEQDPLESGIEIICRPPGKKLQNVLLLSGGEKSMSAIALIFAIFKVKPSPFCILDEIDAALDEANVDRFSRILQEFATGSQFIVITHNKRTIANANVMYGITMQESGVSRIVSVKFGKNVQEKVREPEVVAEAI